MITITAPILALIHTCAPMVAPSTMTAVITVESAANPYAIGIVDAHLEWQPRDRKTAQAVVKKLEAEGRNYSVGIAQVNRANFKRYGITPENAFEVCRNLNVGGKILSECYARTAKVTDVTTLGALNSNYRLRQALSCYYSGQTNSLRGQRYAARVFRAKQLLYAEEKN